ncbi:uncharacterized protein LOC106774635 [Vigna radiata var. radiata]|uniref:Uncharacterized protein LOC106774635 n=1 Tax=Vigna radiata var. radiata TaxID=3916 RepID=A0A1S3VFM9_VIGRR|nr:uncharacterized protein LOC106774635 [Vigna radiata var. radiata]XP_014517166.1 uncharacterized protein LOC106774635 [Vigna radiata var. radiata]XP_014517167.1 uncharacterized protein LOC106774635 [Vigna radiata var. radiata]XP_014517168.1 uncharacterized protein LOC106774635 [Vigna radiata var. radiata]
MPKTMCAFPCVKLNNSIKHLLKGTNIFICCNLRSNFRSTLIQRKCSSLIRMKQLQAHLITIGKFQFHPSRSKAPRALLHLPRRRPLLRRPNFLENLDPFHQRLERCSPRPGPKPRTDVGPVMVLRHVTQSPKGGHFDVLLRPQGLCACIGFLRSHPDSFSYSTFGVRS